MTLRTLGGLTRAAASRRTLRYVAASGLSTAFGQVVLVTAFGLLRWSAREAAVCSFVMAAVASYHLNRSWVWGRRGRSDLLREVVPFWAVAAVGLVLSTVGIVLAEEQAAAVTDDRAVRTAVVVVASWAAVAAVWVLKYLVLDRFVFVSPAPAADAAPVVAAAPDRPSR